MENDPLKLYNKKIFSKLFESSNKDSNEKLYKNTLLEFSEEIPKKDLDEENIESNIKEFTHNSLLKRVALEDYILFPPKNDAVLIMEEGNLIEKQEPEKLFENEVDFLQKINKINYLTFSPFGSSFFPQEKNNINNNNTIEEDNKEKNNINKTKEEKMLDILDFEYDNYIINNDLLFNISMGYIDINKLKKESVVSKENFVSKNQRLNQEKKKTRMLAKMNLDNTEKTKNKFEVLFKQDLYETLQRFAIKYKNIDYFKESINEFNDDMNSLKEMEKNSEKNKVLLRWEKEFKDKQMKYNLFLQKKERRERKQMQIKKEQEIKMKYEKLKNSEQQKKIETQLNMIKNKIKKRNSAYMNKRQNMKSVDSSSSNTYRYKNTIDNKNFHVNKNRAKRIKTVSYKHKKDEPKTDRINWNKTKSDYAFGNL